MFENSHPHNTIHIYTIAWARNFCQKIYLTCIVLKGYGISFFNTLYNAFSANFCIAFLEDPLLLNTIPKY